MENEAASLCSAAQLPQLEPIKQSEAVRNSPLAGLAVWKEPGLRAEEVA